MNSTNHPELVSIHGGHSGEFCSHAKDTLEDIVKAYISKGFEWVGIAEHIPPKDDRFLFDNEHAEGLTPATMYQRFERYMQTCKDLQQKYASQITIYVGLETESWSGYQAIVAEFLEQFKPDYFVGSVHHVDDFCIDAEPKDFEKAVAHAGGIIELYCRYFDLQFEMIETLRPPVVGHFDLIRMHDAKYPQHLTNTRVQEKISRNLNLIKQHNLILDYNVSALRKGASEPYISQPILEQVLELGIDIVPGDDSHGVEMVGACLREGIEILKQIGFSTNWRRPI